MARFSPRDPGFTRVPTLFEGLGRLAQSAGAAEEEIRFREIEDEERARREEAQEVELFERGFSRDPRREEVPAEEDIFRGAELGMQSERSEAEPPSIFRGARPGMAAGAPGVERPRAPSLVDGLGQLAEQRGPMETQDQEDVLAIPGAFVEGMGFTPRVLRASDLVRENQARAAAAAGPRTRLAPGVERVTDELFFDEERSPAGRERTRESMRDRERRARLEAVLGAVQRGDEELPPELLAEGLELGLDEDILLRGGGAAAEPIRVGGRDFPDTPAGHTAALAWQESLAEARRTGSGERITGETTRRTLATAAARALDAIRQDVRELSEFERRNLRPGQIQTQIAATISLFGFDSVEELQEEMRTLRLGGTGAGPARSSATGDEPVPEVTDEQIDAWIAEGLSDEEIMDRIQGGG